MKFRSKYAGSKLVSHREEDFGVRDERGRLVGCDGWVKKTLYTAVTDEHAAYWNTVEPGEWFEASYHATRNGETYGSSNRNELFRTEAEADVFVAKQIEKCRKRYVKKYGK
jgi:IS1 family transposase